MPTTDDVEKAEEHYRREMYAGGGGAGWVMIAFLILLLLAVCVCVVTR